MALVFVKLLCADQPARSALIKVWDNRGLVGVFAEPTGNDWDRMPVKFQRMRYLDTFKIDGHSYDVEFQSAQTISKKGIKGAMNSSVDQYKREVQ